MRLFQRYKGEELLNLISKGPCWDAVQQITSANLKILKETYNKNGTIL